MTSTTSTNDNTNTTSDDVDGFTPPTRLEQLKAKAKQIGLVHGANIGEETLSKKIEEFMSSGTNPLVENAPDAPSSVKSDAELRAEARKKANKLHRVNVIPMGPLAQQLEGEIYAAGNSYIGTIKKFIPYNTENGFHVPEIILDVIRERKYIHHYTVKDAQGNEVNKHKMLPAFNIVTLEPLTDAQLKELGKQQRARASYDEDETAGV